MSTVIAFIAYALSPSPGRASVERIGRYDIATFNDAEARAEQAATEWSRVHGWEAWSAPWTAEQQERLAAAVLGPRLPKRKGPAALRRAARRAAATAAAEQGG